MAETAESLFRRGAISDKQAKKLGVLKGTKVERPNEEDFNGKQGRKDQGAGKERGLKDTGADAIDRNQGGSKGKPSKGAGVKNGKGALPKVDAINAPQNKKQWPKQGSGKGAMNPRSKGKIAKQGGQYGGGGQDTQ